MIKKPNTLRYLSAMVMCFVAFSAFKPGFVPEASDQDLSSSSGWIDALPAHPLTPFQEALLNPKKLTPLPPEFIDTETLWLARAIYSETKRTEEQILVAWVIRNRVETGYRGKRTYKDVVLDPYQFSAFMPNSDKKPFYVSLVASSKVPGWQETLHVAYNIRHLNNNFRPFSEQTRHFYSERSMKNSESPSWVEGQSPIDIAPIVDVDATRFRFYEGIS